MSEQVAIQKDNVVETEEFSQWKVVCRQFLRHKLGVTGGIIVLVLYLLTFFGGFIAPYNMSTHHQQFSYTPPTKIHFVDEEGKFHWRPFVYPVVKKRDPITLEIKYTVDTSTPVPIQLFPEGEEYSLWGIKTKRHLFGVDASKGAYLFLFGTDQFGRDLLARTLVGGQVSLTVGIFGILVSFTIGIVVGGASGYYGGWIDNVIQRIIELLRSFPRLPLWLALSMILPPEWSSVKVYFGVVTVLSLIGWTGLARVVRGQVLSIRENEFVLAAKALGARDGRIIIRHVLPNTMSYIIVAATLSFPGMIIGESTISFLGLGIKEPMTSWGLLLKNAQSFTALDLYPWLLIPGIFIVFAVLGFNFLGDALRDALDPFKD